jgi:hypothetical protein
MTRQDYQTSPEFLAAVQDRFGTIDFDLCCTRTNAVAPYGYFHPEFDALAQDWRDLSGMVCYANPPFAGSRLFAEKAATALKSAVPPTVLLLVPASVDSNWYRDFVHERALVLPLSPRITFVDQPAPINRPLMLCVYGANILPGFAPWQWKQPKNKKENK